MSRYSIVGAALDVAGTGRLKRDAFVRCIVLVTVLVTDWLLRVVLFAGCVVLHTHPGAAGAAGAVGVGVHSPVGVVARLHRLLASASGPEVVNVCKRVCTTQTVWYDTLVCILILGVVSTHVVFAAPSGDGISDSMSDSMGDGRSDGKSDGGSGGKSDGGAWDGASRLRTQGLPDWIDAERVRSVRRLMVQMIMCTCPYLLGRSVVGFHCAADLHMPPYTHTFCHQYHPKHLRSFLMGSHILRAFLCTVQTSIILECIISWEKRASLAVARPPAAAPCDSAASFTRAAAASKLRDTATRLHRLTDAAETACLRRQQRCTEASGSRA